MYSKKVMQHFKKPHNYGRIENADGVGEIGNIVCLTPSQNIHINSGLKEVNIISKRDKVLSHDGKYNFIVGRFKRDYQGGVVEIKNKLGIIKLTPEHLILSIKVPKRNRFLRTRYKKELIFAWHHAGQLEKGDIILYPVPKEEKDLEYLEINIPKLKWDFNSKDIPNKVPVNLNLLRLFGYFLSEGNICEKPCSNYITFTLNINEKDIVEDIRKIAKDLFNLDVVVREIKERNTVAVYLYSAILARFFKRLFGNGAAIKKIPDFIMILPKEKQKALIFGLWKGDGYINLNRSGARGGYSTISYNIAQQLKIILLRQKIVPSIYKEKEKKVKGVLHQENYRIHIGQRDSLINLSSILGIKYYPKSYKSEDSWFDDDYLYTPITDRKKEEYNGTVHNLEVQGVHSYTSEAFCLHNCGDLMKLYIKIGRNKKGEEIIKDVKFETFGCVAAISSSSAVTDIAKGKTLKEALEINSQKVVKALGGLPPIKYHCSLLGADALLEAIYDYFSKNKREVPEKLQKNHLRLEAEKKELAERYKQWR